MIDRGGRVRDGTRLHDPLRPPRLRAHAQYELGMRFMAAPDAATGANMGGFLWDAPPAKEGVMRAIAHQLSQQVELHTG